MQVFRVIFGPSKKLAYFFIFILPVAQIFSQKFGSGRCPAENSSPKSVYFRVIGPMLITFSITTLLWVWNTIYGDKFLRHVGWSVNLSYSKLDTYINKDMWCNSIILWNFSIFLVKIKCSSIQFMSEYRESNNLT